MNGRIRHPIAVVLTAGILAGFASFASGAITLVGVGSVPGNASDLSGLSGFYTDPTNTLAPIPQNQLGSFGSSIAYSGHGNTYYMTNDRGYSTGLVDDLSRYQTFDIQVNPATTTVTPTLTATHFLTKETGEHFTGLGTAFTGPDPTANLRLDPEGTRVAPDGTLYICDELGPNIYHFNTSGQRIGVVTVPDKFKIASLNADATTETSSNTVGRVTNRGLEGLAISPDGTTLFAAEQSPLIQDGGLNGANNRILKIDLATGTTHEYLYQMTSKVGNVSELLAINDHEFLVDERDKNGGTAAALKKVFKVDLAGATDISNIGTTAINGLPLTGLPAGVTPVSKSLFLDLLDPQFGLAGVSFPEKIEGMAWGPDLPDGRHLLLISSDNDMVTANPSMFYAFAVDQATLPTFVPEAFSAVPEPSSLLLVLILGGVVAVFVRHRRGDCLNLK
jgi:hypothetical protein